jgi:hypothetical protein
MPDSINSQDFHGIGNLIDNAIVAHANSPVVLCSSKFSAADRSRLFRETAQRIGNAGPHIEGSFLKSFAAERSTRTRYIG